MKDILKKLSMKIRNSIKIKIILIYVTSLFIVYIVTWWVLSMLLFQPLEREREQNMMYNSKKIISDVRSIRENYDNIIYRLSNNRIIYKSLSEKCKNYEKVWEALTSIKYTFGEDMARSSIIKKLQVYQQGSDIGEDGRFVFHAGYDAKNLINPNWKNEIIDKAMLLCKYHKISSLYNNVDAYIKIAIDSEEAFGNVVELERDMRGSVYLTNEDNIIIASSKPSTVSRNMDELLPKKIINYVNGKITGDKHLLLMKQSVDENWNVWLLVSSNQFEAKVNHAKIIVGIILFSYGLCSVIILSLILSKVFGRLNHLGDKMEQIKDEMSYISIPERCDEVTLLEIKYNSMLNKLDHTINEMAEVKSQKQRFEFKSLESQINPHFLYNTLGVMRWEALETKNQKLVSMIDDLTTFYRLSLNKGKGMLNIVQELKLVEAYINIQQMRWDNVVNVTIDMDQEIKDVMVPKMILQPLVENIWLHGNITKDGNRKIEITARNLGLWVELKIWDNGDGIEKEIIDEFKKDENMDCDSFGIGITFIRNILKYYYENQFVYEISSNEQFGTLVRIVLPREIGEII